MHPFCLSADVLLFGLFLERLMVGYTKVFKVSMNAGIYWFLDESFERGPQWKESFKYSRNWDAKTSSSTVPAFVWYKQRKHDSTKNCPRYNFTIAYYFIKYTQYTDKDTGYANGSYAHWLPHASYFLPLAHPSRLKISSFCIFAERLLTNSVFSICTTVLH